MHSSDRDGSVRHARDAFRYFLRWLIATYPEVDKLCELTVKRSKMIWAAEPMSESTRETAGLSPAHTRYISPLLQFFRDTSQWVP